MPSLIKLLLLSVLTFQSLPSHAGGYYYFIKITKVESHPKSHTIYFEETPYPDYKMHMEGGIFEDCQTITWTVGKQPMGFFARVWDFFKSLFSTASSSAQLQQNVDYLANHKDKIYEIHDIEAFNYVDKCHLASNHFDFFNSSFEGVYQSINPKIRE